MECENEPQVLYTNIFGLQSSRPTKDKYKTIRTPTWLQFYIVVHYKLRERLKRALIVVVGDG